MFCCVPFKRRIVEPSVFEDDPDEFKEAVVMPTGHGMPISDESRQTMRRTLSELAVNQPSAGSLSRNMSSLSLYEWDQPHQTEIIFDWDDTLFPTTWLRSQSGKLRWQDPLPATSPYLPIFQDCSSRVNKLLTIACELGSVSIVTLGAPSWLRHSLRNFMPEVLATLSTLHVNICFAREEADLTEPERDSVELKRRSMRRLLTKFYSHYPGQSWKNAVSIGDSAFERQALLDVVGDYEESEGKRCRCKTVKLASAPDLEQFNSQLDLLSTWLRPVIRFDSDCDINLDGSIEDVLKWKHLIN